MTTSFDDKDPQHKPSSPDSGNGTFPSITLGESEYPVDNVEIFSKPNPAILARHHHLSRQERLYSNLLFANATSSLLRGERRHSIDIQEFRRLTNYQHKDYRELKRSLGNLLTKKIEFGALDDNMPHIKAMTWIAEYELKDGILNYEYSTSMEEELRNLIRNNPKLGYTKLDLLIQNKLMGKHALTLYEISKKYANVKSTGFKDIDWWRDVFSLKPDQYPQWNELNRSVFLTSIKEINKKSDILISMETKGRPIQSIKIAIAQNPHYKSPIIDDIVADEEGDELTTKEREGSLEEEAISCLIDIYGLDEKDIQLILSNDKYKERGLFIEVFQALESKRKSGGITKSLTGYALTTYRDYKRPKLPSTPTPNPASAIDLQRKKKRAEELEQITLQKKKQLLLLSQHYDALTKQDQEKVKKGFIAYLVDLKNRNEGGTYILLMIDLVAKLGLFTDTSDTALNYLIPYYSKVYPDVSLQDVHSGA